jgi:hypothetical protein
MNKNTLTYLAVVLIVAGIIVLGYFFIKPNHGSQTDNPYALGLDSLGMIAPEQFCATEYSAINLEGAEAHAISTDDKNRIWVSVDKKMLCYQADGTLISSFNSDTIANALATFEDILVAGFSDNVRIFNSQGKIITSWKLKNPKSHITSIAVRANQIFVAEATDAMVYQYDSAGKLIQTFGQKIDKKDLTYFFLPSNYFDVALGEEETIWIANTGRHKLVQMDEAAEIVSHWGETSSAVEGFCGCCNPSNFAILSDGSFITAEKGIVRVKKYNRQGKFECVIAGPATFTEDAVGLDIAVDSNDKIFILEPDAMKIHIFDFN